MTDSTGNTERQGPAPEDRSADQTSRFEVASPDSTDRMPLPPSVSGSPASPPPTGSSSFVPGAANPAPPATEPSSWPSPGPLPGGDSNPSAPRPPASSPPLAGPAPAGPAVGPAPPPVGSAPPPVGSLMGGPPAEAGQAADALPPSVRSTGWSPLGAAPVSPPVRTGPPAGQAHYLPPVAPPGVGAGEVAVTAAKPSAARWGWRAMVSFVAGGLIAATGFGAAQLSNTSETTTAAPTQVSASATTVPADSAGAATAPLAPPDVDEPAAFVAKTLGPSVWRAGWSAPT